MVLPTIVFRIATEQKSKSDTEIREVFIRSDTLKRANGNKSEAGRMLGLKSSTLHYKLKRHGLLDDKNDS